jgi:hypothetical protein
MKKASVLYYKNGRSSFLSIYQQVIPKQLNIKLCNLFIILTTLVLLHSSTLLAKDITLPYPPRAFFVELAKTEIPAGKVACCNRLRKMLTDSVMISPYLAVKLFREGKIIIGDARLMRGYKASHILGALPFPHNKVDFMKLKPINKPIALY